MKKNIFLFILLFSGSFMFSQSESYVPSIKTQKAFTKIDFLSINLPSSNHNLGLAGIHYNLNINDWSYAGLGIYGAVGGDKGGLFTLGVNAGVKKELYENLFVDAGFHFGGGGGNEAEPDKSLFFVLPHINLVYDFEYFSLTGGYSYVDFFKNASIKGHQVNFGVEFPLDFNYADISTEDRVINLEDLKSSVWNKNTNRASVMLHLNNQDITGSFQGDNNGRIIHMAGLEIATYIHKNWFAFFKVDGAYEGIDAGYMDMFLGGGYHYSFNKNRTNILAKFALGAGGGGGINTQGGYLVRPDISIEQKIFKDTYISINKGYVFSPNLRFQTDTFGIGIKRYIERNEIAQDDKTYHSGVFKGLEFVINQNLYFNAKRKSTPTENLQLMALQINFNLNRNLYIAAQTAFATYGKTGPYAEGLIGLGARTTPFFNETTTVFTQVLGGAGGGGNVAIGNGPIIKTSLGLEHQFSKTLSLRAGGGYAAATDGDLSSAFVNLGLKYSFSFLNLR